MRKGDEPRGKRRADVTKAGKKFRGFSFLLPRSATSLPGHAGYTPKIAQERQLRGGVPNAPGTSNKN